METKDQELEEWSETGEVMELSGERERERKRERDYMCFNDERGLEKQ